MRKRTKKRLFLLFLTLRSGFDCVFVLSFFCYSDETIRRMAELSKRRNMGEQTEEQITARKRMALFPSKNVEVSILIIPFQ